MVIAEGNYILLEDGAWKDVSSMFDEKCYVLCSFFFLVTRGVRVSLRAPQLFPGPIEHPASLVGR